MSNIPELPKIHKSSLKFEESKDAQMKRENDAERKNKMKKDGIDLGTFDRYL